MRRPFTTADALSRGWTPRSLRWAVDRGRMQRLERAVYLEGPEPPTQLERGLGRVVAVGGVATGGVAASLHELDAVSLAGAWATVPSDVASIRPRVRRYDLAAQNIVEIDGFRCTDGLWTLADLSRTLDDLRWEQALESALRANLTTVAHLEALLRPLGHERFHGVRRMRRVLGGRPPGAEPTESLLETLMVQLIRDDAGLPEPSRQVRIDEVRARVDLAWPELGVFIELDGQHHKSQPLYDASRETAIVAATGWLPARFTWTEVVSHPRATARKLRSIVARAGGDPFRARFAS